MDRLITVTSGSGSTFKKEEMLESEYNERFKVKAEDVQTEYDSGESGAVPTKTDLGKMNTGDLTNQAEVEGVTVTPEMDTNAKLVKAILEGRK